VAVDWQESMVLQRKLRPSNWTRQRRYNWIRVMQLTAKNWCNQSEMFSKHSLSPTSLSTSSSCICFITIALAARPSVRPSASLSCLL